MTGRISDERFARMSATYEAEQQTLEKQVATGSSAFRLSTPMKKKRHSRYFYRLCRTFFRD